MEDSSRLFMYSRAPRMTPDTPASANMYARTAVMRAKLRVFAEPRPPYAPRYRAGPLKTGISFGGSSILVFATGRHQFNSGWLRRHAAIRATVRQLLALAMALGSHSLGTPLEGIQ